MLFHCCRLLRIILIIIFWSFPGDLSVTFCTLFLVKKYYLLAFYKSCVYRGWKRSLPGLLGIEKGVKYIRHKNGWCAICDICNSCIKILNTKTLVGERRSFCHLYPRSYTSSPLLVALVRIHKYQYLALWVSADLKGPNRRIVFYVIQVSMGRWLRNEKIKLILFNVRVSYLWFYLLSACWAYA